MAVAILLTDGFEDGEAFLCRDIFARLNIEIKVRAIPLSLDDGSSGLNVIM